MSKATIGLKGGNDLLVIKGVSHEIKAEQGKPIVRLISTASIDHDGDIIWQGPNDKGAGWVLAAYNANPKIFFGHQTWEMPLGGGRAFLDKHATHGVALFHEDDFDQSDELAVRLEGKVRSGYIRESSVGFIGTLSAPREDHPYGREFYEQRLLEATYCNWGANPDTEVMAKDFFARNPAVALQVETSDSQAAAQQQKDVADALADYEVRLKAIERIIADQHAKQTAEDALHHYKSNADNSLDSLVAKLKAAGLVMG